MSPTNLSAIRRNLARLRIGLAIFLLSALASAQSAPAASAKPSSPPPLPAASPSAAPSSSAAVPGAAPPPYMYQEPWTPPAGAQPAPGPSASEPPVPVPPVYRGAPPPYPPPAYPPPYVYEPPPPPPTFHRAPVSALWLGARLGALFPFGSVYTTGYDPSGYYAFGESWSGLASGGPSVEVNVGGRFGRRYIIYGFWEHAFMGTGGDPTWRTTMIYQGSPALGDQTSASTDYPGLGFRWSSRPDSVGFLVDLGVGYRWFREKWDSGATMTLQGFGEFRAGFGADVRVNRSLSISPLLMFSSGEFHDRKIEAPGQVASAIPSYTGTHGTVTLTVGAHFDLAPTY